MNRIFVLNNGSHGAYYAILQSDEKEYRKLYLSYFEILPGNPKAIEISFFTKETQNLEKQARKYINEYNQKHGDNFVLWSY